MSKYSKKGLEKRKLDRKHYAKFYQKHTLIIKKDRLVCEECGAPLRGHVSEVAHILPKNYFKSVATLDENIIYLCGMYSENQCHSKFDDSKREVVKAMSIYPRVAELFLKIEPLVEERIPYKTYQRFTD